MELRLAGLYADTEGRAQLSILPLAHQALSHPPNSLGLVLVFHRPPQPLHLPSLMLQNACELSHFPVQVQHPWMAATILELFPSPLSFFSTDWAPLGMWVFS